MKYTNKIIKIEIIINIMAILSINITNFFSKFCFRIQLFNYYSSIL